MILAIINKKVTRKLELDSSQKKNKKEKKKGRFNYLFHNNFVYFENNISFHPCNIPHFLTSIVFVKQ